MEKIVHLLLLNYEFPPLGGGAANATYYLLKEFAKHDNITVDLITSSTGKKRIEQFSEKITVHYVDIGKNEHAIHHQSNKELLTYSFKAYRYAKKLQKKKHFDLIHAFFGIPCGVIAQKLHLPYIVSLRGSDVPFYNPRFAKLDKYFFQYLSAHVWKGAGAIVANSKGLKELALKSQPEQKISVIYNGVESSLFPKKNYTNKSETTDVKIICIARLIPRKGLNYLIDALHKLPVTLTIVGDGPEREALQSQANLLGLKAKFEGALEHSLLPEILTKHDLFVLPSLNEGMSNTVLEALAAGLPALVTDTGGSAELVTEGVNGFLVPKKDLLALRKRVEYFIENKSELSRMGKESRKKSLELSWESCAQHYFDLYEEVLANGKKK